MSKREMALWYEALCAARVDFPMPGYKHPKAQNAWDEFWMEWPRQLFVEAGCPKGAPWWMD